MSAMLSLVKRQNKSKVFMGGQARGAAHSVVSHSRCIGAIWKVSLSESTNGITTFEIDIF
jgi:hypothetical protein